VLQARPAGRDPALGGTGPCPRVAAESIDDHGDGASRCVTDAVTDIAEPFAAATIGIALRLEPEHWDRLRLLTDRASANLDPMISGPAAERARRASSALSEYLAGQAARLRRRDPPVDLAGLSADADLSEAERIGVFTLIAVGGYQPLVLLLAAAVDQLLARPALLDLLRTEPGPALALAIVDETLRLHSPIPFTSRVCPVTGAAGVPAGGRALALLAAANRDPAVFDRPAEFDPERPANPHLAFGTGPHYCLGAPLVRHATAEMISQLVQRRPGIRRVPGRPPMLAPSVIPRGLASLPVTWPSGVW
jgi:cytochrome P450